MLNDGAVVHYFSLQLGLLLSATHVGHFYLTRIAVHWSVACSLHVFVFLELWFGGHLPSVVSARMCYFSLWALSSIIRPLLLIIFGVWAARHHTALPYHAQDPTFKWSFAWPGHFFSSFLAFVSSLLSV